MESRKSKGKGGAQKAREKRSRELAVAGKDPKQMKLSFTVDCGLNQETQAEEDSAGPSTLLSLPDVSLEEEESISQREMAGVHQESNSGESSVGPSALSSILDVSIEEEITAQTDTHDTEVEMASECSSEQSFPLQTHIESCDDSRDIPELECNTPSDATDLSHDLSHPIEIPFSLPSVCSIAEKLAFVEKHPFQPTSMECDSLPFKEADFYYRRKQSGDLIKRSWLTCKLKDRKLEAFYCSICIAFSDSSSSFITGCSNFRHCYQAVNKHEVSKSHCDAASVYFTMKKHRSIEVLINQDQAAKRKKEVLQNIEVMKRIFDIVKLLGKQGFPFRAHGTNESLYNLNNTEINHGNFLEIVLLLSQYDVPLKNHLEKCIQESEKRRKRLQDRRLKGKRATGRGSLVTFLSYKTVKKVFMAVVGRMKASIVSEIGEKRYSIQVDSTQDAGIVDQATVVTRYIKDDVIKERLIAVLPVKDASGRGFNELLMSSFEVLGLDYQKIAGESFDGAANMRSAYVGLRAQIASVVPDAVYIWCYSHILNLCVSDCCEVLEAKKFFGLLNRLATFIGDSHKRMNVWKDQLDQRHGQEKMLRLQKIGETRWWAKEKALNWIFGEKHTLYLDTLEVLLLISQSNRFDSKATSEASSLFETLCEFRTLLTASIFLQVFDVIGPVSKYLQSSGLDFMLAWRMVESAIEQLKKIDFDYINEKAKHFATKMNDLMAESEFLNTTEVETVLPVRRVAKKKRMAGELAHDEQPTDETQHFRAFVFRPILDQIIQSLTERFSQNKQLVMDSQYLDPRFFESIRRDPRLLETGTLTRISQLAKVDESSLKAELVSFAHLFPNLIGSISEEEQQEMDIIPDDDDDDDEADNESESSLATQDDPQQEPKCKSCKKCFLCCHRLLLKYNLYSAAYENLSTTYEYLLTLSFTQVACERAFSKLKLIKTRLRATMGQDLLDALMIMSVERDLLELVQFQDVLEIIRESSPLMRSLLTV